MAKKRAKIQTRRQNFMMSPELKSQFNDAAEKLEMSQGEVLRGLVEGLVVNLGLSLSTPPLPESVDTAMRELHENEQRARQFHRVSSKKNLQV